MIFDWAPSPIILTLGPLTLRWYGMLFAIGFYLGFLVVRSAFLREKKPVAHLDSLLMHTIAGCVIGARLGHCLFYEPERYLSDPLEILFVWQGGLASHGAAIGLFVSTWLYSRQKDRESFWWTIDRLCLAIPLGGACVRIGNFFNSEIIGQPTNGDWGVVFSRVDSLPRHPAMLYEAAIYLLIFGVLQVFYQKWGSKTPRGMILGLCLIFIFAARFVIEFWKENQVDFESAMTLNMGQLLSIPIIIFGFWLVRSSKTRPLS